jgi:hypothetical protein
VARFNPETQVDEGQNWTNASEGTKSSLGALGVLFEGIGQTAGSAIKSLDQQNLFNIEQEANREVDGYLKDATNPNAPNASGQFPIGAKAGVGVTGGATPLPIQRMTGQLTKLQQAHAEGKLSDLNLYNRQANIVKSMITKYGPGYTSEIMSAVSRATGLNPAENIRQELNKQYAESQVTASDQLKFRRNQVQEWADKGILGRMGVDPASIDIEDEIAFSRIQSRAAKIAGEDAQVDVSKKRIELNKATREEDKGYNYDQASKAVGMRGDQFFSQVGDFTTKLLNQFETLGRDGFSPEELKQLTETYGILRTQYEIGLDGFLSTRDKSGFAWKDNLQPNDYKALKEREMSRFDSYSKLLFDENFGAVGAQNRLIKAREEGFKSKVLEQVLSNPNLEPVRLAKALKEMGISDELATYFMEKQFGGVAELFSAEQASALSAMTGGLVTGQLKDFPTMLNELAEEQGVTNKPQFIQKLTENIGMLLADPSLPPDRLNIVMDKLVSTSLEGGLLGMFGQGATRESVFKRIAQPELAGKLKNQSVFPKYNRWVKNSFTQLVKPAMDTINSITIDPKYIDVTWDEGSSHFVVSGNVPTDTRQRGTLRPRPGGVTTVEAQEIASQLDVLQERVGFINQYADRIVEISKLSGEDPNTVLRTLYQGLQIPEEMFLPNKMIQGLMNPPEEGEGTTQTGMTGGNVDTQQTAVIDAEGVPGEVIAWARERNLPPHQTAALLQTIAQESGFRPGIRGDAGNSWGLFQMNPAGGRRDRFTQRVPDWQTNVRGQLDAWWEESQNEERGTGDRFRNAATIDEAMEAMLDNIRPRNWLQARQRGWEWRNRLAGSQAWLAELAQAQ